VLPVFEHVRRGDNILTREDEEWLETTCFGCMYGVVELFSRFYPTLHPLLGDELRLLVDCMKQRTHLHSSCCGGFLGLCFL